MEKFSINQLAELTGFAHRTLKSRLKDQIPEKKGRANLYTFRQLIDSIIENCQNKSDLMNLEQERAQLANAQRLKLEREAAIAESVLLDSKTVLQVWSTVQVQQRQKILNSEIPEELKEDLIEELRDIELAEYKA